jgi:hypothetical protein
MLRRYKKVLTLIPEEIYRFAEGKGRNEKTL